jgi:5-methylcytosine-specific restriction endonuclease McrA
MTSAREETARLADLLRNEHSAMADFLVALAEFDRGRLWIDLGYSSLFWFLHRELELSKGAAHYRKTAAELIQRYPRIVEPLRDGRLCITTVQELSEVLAPDNIDDVLPRFFHLSRREAKEVSAELLPDPAPPVRTVVTVLPAVPAAIAPALLSAAPEYEVNRSRGWLANPPHANSAVPDEGSPPRGGSPRATIEPLTRNLSRLHVTVSRRLIEKLDGARVALSHSHPGASEEEILEVGLDLILDRAARRRGIVPKPQKRVPVGSGSTARSEGTRSAAVGAAGEGDPRYIPAEVRRAVWLRDRGRCAFPLACGDVCGSRLRLELDHIIPVAQGGKSTIENVRICCRFHNVLAARRTLGDAAMDRYTRTARPTG